MSLPRYDLAIFDNVPRAASGAWVYVYTQPTSPVLVNVDGTLIDPTPWTPSQGGLATIYSDNAGSYPQSNPFQLDGNGNGWFYAVEEQYTIVINGGTLSAPAILPDQNLVLVASGGATFQTNGVNNSLQTLLNLVQGSNITVTAAGGNITIAGTAAPVTLKTNGTNNGSQVILNLVNGSGMSITDNGSGSITFASTGGVTLQVQGVPNGDQSLLNIKHGTHTTVTDDGVGGVTIEAVLPVFQQNTTPLTTQTPVNFQNGANIQITNPSAGNVQVAVVGITDAVQIATLAITSAQIKTLRATPLTILGAQGPLTLIEPLKVTLEFIPVTTAYATVSTADIAVYVATTKATNFTGDSTGLLDQTVKTFESLTPTAAKSFTTDTLSDNQPLKIANVAGAEYTLGDGTLLVTVYYVLTTVV